MRIFNYDQETGEFLGESVADESPLEPGVYLLPACSTDIAPPLQSANQRAIFQAGAWLVVDIPQPPAPPVPTAAEIAASRKAEILGQLAQIDAKSIRPLREGDSARVAALEEQAVTLRAELATL